MVKGKGWQIQIPLYIHGTIIRTGITYKKIPLLNSAWILSRARLAINEKQKYFSLPDHQLAENLILVFDL